MDKCVTFLGSTGSIGRAALEVAASLNGTIGVAGLAAGSNWRLLAEQADTFRAPLVAIADEQHYDRLRRACPTGTEVLAGADGLVELADRADANFVLAAVVGAAGLPPVMRAVERGLDIGLANKEALVVAGALLMPLARERNSRLIPVDSEHSAIFQAMHSGKPHEVHKIFLTASGGPFRTWTLDQMREATLEAALQHPTWAMGPKITIDSATMMNKALEVIEAAYLFELEPDRIEVLVHPESIVHSMVEFCDGSIVAQLGSPDMKTPIQYALTHPKRVTGLATRLDWSTARRLHFEPPDFERFPALRLGFEAARIGGTAGAVLNAANEAVVEAFRAGAIRFGEMMEVAERVFRRHRPIDTPTLEQLLACDAWARNEVSACIPS